MKMFKNPLIWMLLSFTIGLAPFVPEPHVWGKLKWVLGGGNGMEMIDWFDFAMHGAPWVFLFISITVNIAGKLKKPNLK